jgi:cell division protein FtsX
MLAPMRTPGSLNPARTLSASRLVVEAGRGLRRHPLPTLLVVAVVAVSLTLVGASALASEQARLLDHWYRDRMPIDRPGADSMMTRQLLPLLAWGRNALGASLVAAAFAVALTVMVSMRVAALTRHDDVRAMRVVGASRADIRLSLLTQATATGLAGALLAFAVLRLGTWLVMRGPQRQAALDGLPMVGPSDLLAVLPILVVTGVAACWAGGLLAQRTLMRP